MHPQVKGKFKNKPIVLSTIDVKDNAFNLVVVEPKFKQTKSKVDYKATQIKNYLDHINVIDEICLINRLER